MAYYQEQMERAREDMPELFANEKDFKRETMEKALSTRQERDEEERRVIERIRLEFEDSLTHKS